MSNEDKLIPINIEDEMKSAYIDYSMSVIVSRALPDVRDGMKPVHRRVLYGMHDLGVARTVPTKNLHVLLEKYWENITHMVTVLFTIPWFGWHSRGVCVT